MRTFLAVLAACAAFALSAAGVILSDPDLILEEDSGWIFIALFLAFLIPFCLMIAGGVLVAPKVGLRSHILDRIRGIAAPPSGGWAHAVLIGLIASVSSIFAAAAIRTLSPDSFPKEDLWHGKDLMGALELVSSHLLGAILCLVGLLNLLAYICIRMFGGLRRSTILIVAIGLMEAICFGLVILLLVPLEYPLTFATFADLAASSIASIACAWLYVTRSLEHGVLALMWSPVVIMVFQPLWAFLGI